MTKLAIVYHSAHGHTEFIARQVQIGTSGVDGVDTSLELKQQALAKTAPTSGSPGRYRPDDALLTFLKSL